MVTNALDPGFRRGDDFLRVYQAVVKLDRGQKGLRRQYCYYTQYAPALVCSVGGETDEKRILTPLVHYLYPVFGTKVQLYRMLAAIQPGISFFRVAGAYDEAVAAVVALFAAIPRGADSPARRPKVAIFGDLYARDNDTINQNLIRFIEDQGGEVITTPYSTYAKMIAGPYMRKWLIEGHCLSVLTGGAIMAAVAP